MMDAGLFAAAFPPVPSANSGLQQFPMLIAYTGEEGGLAAPVRTAA